MVSGKGIASDNLRHSGSMFILLRAVRIRAALLTQTGSGSETESNTGDVSFGAGSTQRVKTRGEDPSLS
jgi:hypothetical protein